jgi:hypothetical protein
MRRDRSEHFQEAVDSELTRLSALSADELRLLSEHQSIQRVFDDVSIDMSIWHHSHSSGDLIVVQAFRPIFRWFPRLTRPFVEGLIVRTDGQIIPAQDSDLLDYS